MPARQESCCFTGHRPAKLPWGYNERDPRCVRLKERIADAVLLAYQEGYRHFLCGMAQGCDLYFCEAVLALRERYQEVTVEAAIPCPTQADAWPEQNGIATGNWLPGAIWRPWSPTLYSSTCMQRRDRYMVDTPCCSSPPLTAPPAGPATRWNTPCGGESRFLMCRFPRNSCKMKLLYCIDARRGSSSERAWMV
ncbi:MAG: SLOG family protein [Dysosmobacter sp.]